MGILCIIWSNKISLYNWATSIFHVFGSRKAMELLSEDGFYFITFFHIIPSVKLFGFSNL